MALTDAQRQVIRDCSKDDAAYETLLALYESLAEQPSASLPDTTPLRGQEQHFLEKILSTLPGLLYVYDAPGRRAIFVNHNIAVLLGYTPEKMLENDFSFITGLLHPDDLPVIWAHVEQLRRAADGEVLVNEYRVRDAQDNWRWFQSHSSVFARDTGGQVREILSIAIDITEQRHAEAALREQQHFVNRIMAHVPDIVYVYNVEGRQLVYINEGALRTLGFAREETLPKTLDEFGHLVHPDDVERVAQVATWYVAASDDDLMEIEFRLQDAAGVWHWMYSREAIFSRHADGTVHQVFGISHDITLRKEALDALHRSEARQRALLKALPDLIFVLDREGTYLECYASSPELLVLPPEELIGRRFTEILPPENAAHLDYVCHTLDTGQMSQYQYTLSLQGKLHYFDARMVFKDAGSVIVSVRDITEQKRLLDALTASENRQKAILQALPDLMFVVNRDGMYLDYHAPQPELLYVPPEQFLRRRIPDVLPAEVADKQMNMVEQVLATGQPELYEYTLDLHGQRYHFEARMVMQSPDTVLQIVRDITARRQAETVLLEQEKLQVALHKEQELNHHRNRMMMTLNHELRTPLAIIGTASALLERYRDRLTPEKQQERFQQIHKQIQHMSSILDNIHLVLQGQQERLRPEMKEFDLVALCQRKIEILQPTLGTQHHLVFTPDERLHQVYGDERLITYIIINLLNNAIKYSPPQTTVQLEITVEEPDVIIRVSDEGANIAPEDLKFIFDPFYRGNNAADTPGLGLGMSIARDAVQSHQGTIELESAPGKGTLVTVRLPILRPVSGSAPS